MIETEDHRNHFVITWIDNHLKEQSLENMEGETSFLNREYFC